MRKNVLSLVVRMSKVYPGYNICMSEIYERANGIMQIDIVGSYLILLTCSPSLPSFIHPNYVVSLAGFRSLSLLFVIVLFE